MTPAPLLQAIFVFVFFVVVVVVVIGIVRIYRKPVVSVARSVGLVIARINGDTVRNHLHVVRKEPETEMEMHAGARVCAQDVTDRASEMMPMTMRMNTHMAAEAVMPARTGVPAQSALARKAPVTARRVMALDFAVAAVGMGPLMVAGAAMTAALALLPRLLDGPMRSMKSVDGRAITGLDRAAAGDTCQRHENSAEGERETASMSHWIVHAGFLPRPGNAADRSFHVDRRID